MISQTISKKSVSNSKMYILRFGICFAFAFIISCTKFGLIKSPFSISLAGALTPVYSVFVMLGSLASYLFVPDVYTLPFALAVIAAAGLRCITTATTPLKNAVVVSLCTIMTYMVDFALYGFDYKILFNYVYSSLVSGAVAYYMTVMFYSPKGIKSELLSSVPVGATMCFILTSLCSSFSLFGINIGRVISVIVILLYSRSYGYTGGAISGVLATMTLVMCGVGKLNGTVFFGVSGIASAAFSKYKKTVSAAAFILLNLISGTVSGYTGEDIKSYIDIAVGALIFCLMPLERLHAESAKVSCSAGMDSEMQRFLSFRMRTLADALADAGQRVVDYNDAENQDTYSHEGNVRSVYNFVCKDCSGKNYCWGCRNNTTYDVFSKGVSGKITSSSDFPEEFDYCFKTEDIVYEFLNVLNNQLVDITSSYGYDMSRSMLSQQLDASAEIMRMMSSEVVCGFAPDRRMTERVKKCLVENDIGFVSAAAYYNADNRLIVEVYSSKNAYITGYRLYKTLADEFEKNFDCTKHYDGEEMRFLVSERPEYNIESCIVQKSIQEGEPNGDTCDCFKDDFGNVYLVISDGMGTGKKAAGYSAETVSLFKKFITSGMGINESIKIVNSILMAKSNEECSATLDVARFNLDNGDVEMFKSGAASTIMSRNGMISSTSSSSYPLGILNEVKPYFQKFSFRVNDILVMFSDGVSDEIYSSIKKEIQNNRKNISDMSTNICNIAQKSGRDDISVIVAKLIRQKV